MHVGKSWRGGKKKQRLFYKSHYGLEDSIYVKVFIVHMHKTYFDTVFTNDELVSYVLTFRNVVTKWQ